MPRQTECCAVSDLPGMTCVPPFRSVTSHPAMKVDTDHQPRSVTHDMRDVPMLGRLSGPVRWIMQPP